VVSNALEHKPLGDGVLTAAATGALTSIGLGAAGGLLAKGAGRFFGAVAKDAEGEVASGVEQAARGEGSSLEGGVCALSFAPDTPVATPSGEQPIAQVKPGDAVTAYDPSTGTATTQTVTATSIHHDDNLVDVTLQVTTPAGRQTTSSAGQTTALSGATSAATGTSSAQPSGAHTEVIHTTTTHPWLTADHGWVPASFLQVGEPVVQLDGTTATVETIRSVAGAAEMWDLTVSNLHTFAVGAGEYVVHNCDSSKVDFGDDRQIQEKYDEHAKDFGVTGNNSKATRQEFVDAMKRHIEDPDTVEIPGTYRKMPVTHYYNPRTDLNVMADESGKFLSGWRLNEVRVWNLITRGSL
jgi:hypothetical protein